MKVGIVGCGTIGSAVIKEVLIPNKKKIKSIFIYDKDKIKLKNLRLKFPELKILNSLNQLVLQSDFIIESASIPCVVQLLPLLRKYKKDGLIMSTGGLLGKENFLKRASREGIEIIVPSGAIGGIDVINTIRGSGIQELTLSTYKPIPALKSSPYVKKRRLELDRIKDKELIFEGGVKEAIKGFPQSINVSATLLLATGIEDFKIKIYACRNLKTIVHKIELKSKVTNLKLEFQNHPSRENPKTSALAIASACEETRQYLTKHLDRR